MNDERNEKRCAVYTRKSCEEGLELKYNSLDAQRDACEAYVKIQFANGWRLLPKRYDDGGFSGGDTKRPALQQLIADIKAGLVDTVVVYKIDRLSRSLRDFAELFRTFDDHHVSFVSVTQQIDTTSATGRMMLNILMSFAQFEREMSADRTRDKIRATRRKGMWTGGVTPYGYVLADKNLIVDEKAAEGVRRAFERYAEIASTYAVAAELNRSHPKANGARWTSQGVLGMLRNVLYTGRISIPSTGEVCNAIHEGIVDVELFDRVQAILAENGASNSRRERFSSYAPLKGILKCGSCGGAMSPTYSFFKCNGRRRYVYYKCARKAKDTARKCSVPSLAADVIERFVFRRLEGVLRRKAVIEAISPDTDVRNRFIESLDDMDALWSEMVPAERYRIVRLLVREVRVWDTQVEIAFTKEAGGKTETIPCELRRSIGRNVILASEDKTESDGVAIARVLRRAHIWAELLTSGTYAKKHQLADALGLSRQYLTEVVNLEFISPTIIERIAKGEWAEASVRKLNRIGTRIWAEQEEAVGAC